VLCFNIDTNVLYQYL